MLNVLIVGASWYTGAELVNYIHRHAHASIKKIFVSRNSINSGKLFSDIHQQCINFINLKLEKISDDDFMNKSIDAVFLETDHTVSYSLVLLFLSSKYIFFDFSGAYRVKNINIYQEYYGFFHQNQDFLKKSVYGLPEWNKEEIIYSNLISVSGYYASCIQLKLKPILESDILLIKHLPIVNTISGVSDSSRKPNFTNSFCETSLQLYNIFTHSYAPEIIKHLGIPIIFTSHLDAFQRVIIAKITCKFKTNLTWSDIYNIFFYTYKDKLLIRMYQNHLTSIKSIQNLSFCDIGFIIQNEYLVIVTAEDNLLKGLLIRQYNVLIFVLVFLKQNQLFN